VEQSAAFGTATSVTLVAEEEQSQTRTEGLLTSLELMLMPVARLCSPDLERRTAGVERGRSGSTEAELAMELAVGVAEPAVAQIYRTGVRKRDWTVQEVAGTSALAV